MDEYPPEETAVGPDGSGAGPGDVVASPRTGVGARYGLLAAVLALLVSGVSVIAFRGGTSAPSLDTLVPADAVAYVQVTVHPSGREGRALRALLRRLPERQRTKVLSGVDSTLDRAFAESGLTFTRDVKPWIGDHVAVLARPGSGDAPTAVFLAQVKDEGAARTSLARARKAHPDLGAFEVTDGVAYLAKTAAEINALQTEATRASLASLPAYKKLHDRVGDGLMFAYADGAKLSDVASALAPLQGAALFGGSVPTSLALGIHAESDGFVVQGHGTGATIASRGVKSGRPALLEGTSSGLLGAFSQFDIAGTIMNALKAVGDRSAVPGGPNIGGAAEQVKAELRRLLGVDLDADVLPWLHGEFSVLVGGFTPPVPDIGVLIQPTDDAALRRTLDQIASRLAVLRARLHTDVTQTANGFDIPLPQGITIAVRRGKDRLVIASSARYAALLLRDAAQPLANDVVYRNAVSGLGDKIGGQVFLRVDRIRQLIETFLPSEARAKYDQGIAPFLRTVTSIGMRSTQNGDEADFRLKIAMA